MLGLERGFVLGGQGSEVQRRCLLGGPLRMDVPQATLHSLSATDFPLTSGSPHIEVGVRSPSQHAGVALQPLGHGGSLQPIACSNVGRRSPACSMFRFTGPRADNRVPALEHSQGQDHMHCGKGLAWLSIPGDNCCNWCTVRVVWK
ncbi:unnamed protein product [Ostreobium quekettii]|uniref:Uncharacterized protein n=1 Tax=Ostreobium quekettii TaxID=121088 RepID=A0A8S1IQD3_9CHLO|nr:unnamed protein product [Ostreobium quekettii]